MKKVLAGTAAALAASVIIGVGLWVSLVAQWEAGVRRSGGWLE